jgi:nusB family protein
LWAALEKRSQQMEAVYKNKFIRDENISHTLFLENEALQLITRDEALCEAIEKEFLLWRAHDEYINILYNRILESEIYQLAKGHPRSFEGDRQFLADLYMGVIAPDEELFDFLADTEITWTDDFPLVNTLIVKLLKGLRKDKENELVPPLFKDIADREFGIDLLKKAVLNDEKFQQYLVEKTPQWDTERIAEIDAILIKMGITELLKCPSIPVKVTLNEYVEIAKEYSTPKSSVFINGILDTLSKDFTQDGTLKKIGRGLL